MWPCIPPTTGFLDHGELWLLQGVDWPSCISKQYFSEKNEDYVVGAIQYMHLC